MKTSTIAVWGDGEPVGVSSLDRTIDPRDGLIYDAARAEVEMSDFAIAHLARWQTDVLTGARQPRAWPLVVHRAKARDAGELDRVALARRAFEVGMAPAVENHQENFSHAGI